MRKLGVICACKLHKNIIFKNLSFQETVFLRLVGCRGCRYQQWAHAVFEKGVASGISESFFIISGGSGLAAALERGEEGCDRRGATGFALEQKAPWLTRLNYQVQDTSIFLQWISKQFIKPGLIFLSPFQRWGNWGTEAIACQESARVWYQSRIKPKWPVGRTWTTERAWSEMRSENPLHEKKLRFLLYLLTRSHVLLDRVLVRKVFIHLPSWSLDWDT